ncbi:CD209 antigen-like protein B [Protopterus annectens]|uniref:CD209 antigen-like protein B n=1 Tax=Protopterus annectens TaxID=7888 RepID=UPI001CF9BD2A|nr:CD209 antigen-like protein B [Protopterus annectens]
MTENIYANFEDLGITCNDKTQVSPKIGTQCIQGCGTKVFYILIVILVILLACVMILGIVINNQKKEMENVHVTLSTRNASLDNLMQENYEQKKEMENLRVILRTMNASQQTIASLDSCKQENSKRQTCNNGWECFLMCYTFSDDYKNWNDARRACEEDNSHLIVINSDQEQDVFVNMVTSHIWIGLTDQQQEGTWQWVDGTSYQHVAKFWHEGNPDDYNKKEDCVELYHIDGKTLWNDNDCTKKQKWICEKNFSAMKQRDVAYPKPPTSQQWSGVTRSMQTHVDGANQERPDDDLNLSEAEASENEAGDPLENGPHRIERLRNQRANQPINPGNNQSTNFQHGQGRR